MARAVNLPYETTHTTVVTRGAAIICELNLVETRLVSPRVGRYGHRALNM